MSEHQHDGRGDEADSLRIAAGPSADLKDRAKAAKR